MNARWYGVRRNNIGIWHSIALGFLLGLLFFAGRMFDWLAKFVVGL